MAELRRILVESHRLTGTDANEGLLHLNSNEAHYLRRVLRLRVDNPLAVVDGIGHLWEAHLQEGDYLKLATPITHPISHQPCPTPQLCLAVVLPRRGFEEVLRMCCELGINLIQPLRSERSTPQAEDRPARWKVILREAIEQSEQLWQPTLLPLVETSKLWTSPSVNDVFAIATTRRMGLTDLQLWNEGLAQGFDHLWVAIGPEGGWSPNEESSAEGAGWVPVGLGDSILRTCTAAVAATQTTVSTRRIRPIREDQAAVD